MADIIVSPVIDKLIQFLQEEAKLFRGVHEEAKSLQRELKLINALLKDAESREGDMSDAVKTWLGEVKEEANSIEDVMDEYHAHVEKYRHDQSSIFLSFLCQIVNIVKTLKQRHKIASEIQNIKASLQQIKSTGEALGLKPLEQGSASRKTANIHKHDPRWRSSIIQESELVGINTVEKDLTRTLVEGPSTITVISLSGTGGIGKTTLAKIVYNKEDVKSCFDCYAWITVSRSYDREKILSFMTQQICKSATVTTSGEDVIPGLIGHLSQYLKTKRFFIVFDDVWDQSFIETMKLALPINNNGSRIIMTTRNDALADSWKEIASHVLTQKLELLSEKDALDLFCKRAFQSATGGQCPEELKEVSLELIRKCDGLPLAIATIAGLLSTKEKTEFEWKRQLDNLNYGFGSNPLYSSVADILDYSVRDLPYHLKCCFMYFGKFPEDFSIGIVWICRLWIAEGFVKEKPGKTLEEVAEEYLNELIQRNLASQTSDQLCSVHDMMHEIIISRCDPNFCQILDEKESNFKGKGRRLSVYKSVRNVLDNIKYGGVRSVFLFNLDELPNNFLVTLFEKFKLLKVLHLAGAPINDLPKEVGNLFHLKYLDVSQTKVRMLPKSIGKLKNLQSLNLINTLVEELTKEIKELQNLRHLIGYSITEVVELADTVDTNREVQKKRRIGATTFNHGIRIQKGIGCLVNLQTLAFVEAGRPGDVGVMEELENLRQLRDLRISKVTSEIGIVVFRSIMKMTHLRQLEVGSVSRDELLDLQPLSSPPPSLEYLCLWGPLKELPGWMPELRHLRELHLRWSRLSSEVDPLKYIQNLPDLVSLFFWRTFLGGELHFKEGGFPKLKQLWLMHLDGVKEVKIERGVMPLLEKLVIGENPMLKEMPCDIKNLTNLKSLEINNMPREFVLGMQPGGPDYWKVKHIPLIRFKYYQETTAYAYRPGDPALLKRLSV